MVLAASTQQVLDNVEHASQTEPCLLCLLSHTPTSHTSNEHTHTLNQQPSPVVIAAAAAAEAGDILDDIDWTEDMPVPVKRRVRALKEVQQQYDDLMRDFIKERAALMAKYETAAGEVVVGKV